ncbi:MAG: hypothetical protein IJ190_10675 [Prevotella sp.]|nr:hypothetical protein [Prevotella sp.]
MICRKEIKIGKFVANSLLIWLLMLCQQVMAADKVLYVKTAAHGGVYTASGESWDKAISDLQIAINRLNQTLGSGETGAIYVAAGEYYPTLNLDDYFSEGSHSTNDMAFIVYEGITIYGGFPASGKDAHGNEVTDPAKREKGTNAWDFTNETVLSGCLSSNKNPNFVYNTTTGSYNVPVIGSATHVVWFATNETNQYAALNREAAIDGCTIKGGYANSRVTDTRDHTGYGGGAYMVGNSTLRNCIITKCAATLRGGGVYMDGGGLVDHCRIEVCQATGIGITDGYGGGVCADYNGTVRHSVITQCSARVGGGLALCYEEGRNHSTGDAAVSRYALNAIAAVVSNNSATADAGGVFLNNGGTLNHLTIVRNRNFGYDVTYGGRRYGRSGGLFINNGGECYNSVVWGNTCDYNHDVEYAAYTTGSTDVLKPQVLYSAFGHHDITDWSGTSKTNVHSLYKENEAAEGLTVNKPSFGKPSEGAGVETSVTDGINWIPSSNSSLIAKGVQVTDYSDNEVLKNAHVDQDYMGNDFSPVSVLGALVNEQESMKGTTEVPVYYDDFKGSDGSVRLAKAKTSDKLLTIFVDPTHQYSTSDIEEGVGDSWDHPVGTLSKAIQIAFDWRAEQRRNAGHNDGYGWLAYDGEAYSGGYDYHTSTPSRNDEGDGDWLPVQIFVKQGEQSTGGPSSFQSNDLRSGCIRPINDIHVYGGFPATLTGTDVSERDPKTYPSRLNSNLINSNYSTWATHVISLTNVQNTIFDGLQLYYGAATTSGDVTQVGSGGGVIVSNNTPVWVDKGEKKIPQTNNLMRNCVIANCVTDGDGSAIYVNGANTESDLTLENCIFHNNQAVDGVTREYRGTVTANGGVGKATIRLNHCNIMRNQGYAFRTKGVEDNVSITCDNSIIYANAKNTTDDLTTLTANDILCATGPHITGSYCLFDNGVMPTGDAFTDSYGFLTYDQNNNTRYRYPLTANPTTNVGLSEAGDITKFGGEPDWTPSNISPVVNAANDTSSETDLTTQMPRNRGGAADVGALECPNLPVDGAVIYVTQNGAGKMDGSSWGNAIAGNLVYRVGESYVTDKDGKRVTTRDDRYRGGFAIDYVMHKGKVTYKEEQTVTEKRIYQTIEADGSVTTTEETVPLEGSKSSSYTIDHKASELTRVKNDTYIYGEKSGASRNFYRTNLRDSQIPKVSQGTTGYQSTDIDNSLFISNNRDEDYVSGLQFAVEKAAVWNKNKDAADRVQVWVGHGTYEDYKGFVMRDKVEVVGGFPTDKMSAPGKNERRALISQYVPTSKQNESLDEKDYETILQVIDKSPWDRGTWAFKDSVMLFSDKDINVEGNKTVTTTTAVTIPVYYQRKANGEGGYTDYEQVRGSGVAEDCTTQLVNPSFEQNRGTGNWDATKAKWGWTDITGFALSGNATVHGAEIKFDKTEAHTVDFYQDIDGLAAGYYRVSCQGFNKGNAVGNIKLFANSEERVLLTVSTADATETDLAKAVTNLLGSGHYDDNWVEVYVGEGGHLRLGLKGTYTGTGWTVFDNFRLERLADGAIEASTSVREEWENKKVSADKTYSTFRKPVLFMPDVCISTQWPGSINSNSDDKSNARRYTWSTDAAGNVTITSKSGMNYVPYEDSHWDGFTIRHGFLYDYFANRDGGAGVRMYEGGTLENCVIVDNANMGAVRSRGGGGYCDGKTSKAVGCFFVHNINSGIRTAGNDKDTNGGGIYMIVGTCYNSLLANNICWGNDSRGAGIYIEQAVFYNNTVAYNTCRKRDRNVLANNTSTNAGTGHGVHQYEGADGGGSLNVFNTIFYGNTGRAIGSQNASKLNSFQNCYIQSEQEMGGTIRGKMVDCILSDAGKNKSGSTVWNANNPFPNPFEQGDSASALDNFRLDPKSLCINAGVIPANQASTFPKTDVDFEQRIQDCQIDIGAYEYNGAADIVPNVVDGVANYYVTQNGAGTASSSDVNNPACWEKLQKVLDAAGRYKYDNPGMQVIVKVAAEDLGGGNYFKYMATRSSVTDPTSPQADNPRTYSIIVPYGVELWGGYKTTEDSKGTFVDSNRDVIKNKTIMSGIYQSDEQDVRCYHTITFTDVVFDEEGRPTSRRLSEKENEMGAFNRAVLDGLFIEDGQADGALEDDQRGGGAIVPAYAHVRNCIVQNNNADEYGGGLYLKSQGLVSGTVVQGNGAKYGGGIAVEEPDEDAEGQLTSSPDTYAYIISCTVVKNTSVTQGGGLYFRSNVRANSSLFWQNSSDDQGNVAGQTDTNKEQRVENYPLSYCAVEALRVSGVNNISVAGDEDKGIRLQPDAGQRDYNYYGITQASDLARTGMAYHMFQTLDKTYETASDFFATLIDFDMAGLHRMQETEEEAGRQLWVSGQQVTTVRKNNKFIEIGARAINANLSLFVEGYIMTRLFVAHTENVNTDAANSLANSGDPMYHQKGSSFGNPMMRLGDAFDYIQEVRTEKADEYKDQRFEVFVSGGTYYPYHDANNTQGSARNNTFVVPEGVTIIGGIDPLTGFNGGANHFYCQERDEATTVSVSGYTLLGKSTNDIRDEREHYDLNQNSVSEPWEMAKQTIFTGQNTSADEFNLYHVITCFADPKQTGALPSIEPADGEETEESKAKRTIIIDGVTVNNGSARRYSESALDKSMYYRGAGILVDGNWTDAADDEQNERAETNEVAARNIPMVLANCFFQGNTAVQGGAIYTNGDLSVFSCSFAQNLAESPSDAASNTADAVAYIKNCGGGAIACNANLLAVNTIFANNESRVYKTRISDNATLHPHTWASSHPTAGYGGVIWAGDNAHVRLINCDIVCNKATAYPAVYNTKVNTTDDLRHYAVNTIYWGNKVEEGNTAHVMNFGTTTGFGDVEALLFSAYEEGRGPAATVQPRSDRHDYRSNPFEGDYQGNPSGSFDLGGYNHNLIINEDNDNALNGPRFTFPAQGAGYDEYVPSADWFIYRFNGLCDQGWTGIEQTITKTNGLSSAEFTKVDTDKYAGQGIYKTVADKVRDAYGLTLMPYGPHKYMGYASGVYSGQDMFRVSSDPDMREAYAYIDIGVYEYQHIQLVVDNSAGSEVDVIWVAETENRQYGNDGHHWRSPTTKLQWAINTLLANRNGHDKEVRIIKGNYSPMLPFNSQNNLAFTIDIPTTNEGIVTPLNYVTTKGYGIKSLTIKGGYSQDWETYAPDDNPVVFEMGYAGNSSDDQVQHLLEVLNAEQMESRFGDSPYSTPTGKAVPVIIEGITFRNQLALNGHQEGATEKTPGTACAGGAAIYYRDQYKLESPSELLDDPDGELPKITIRKCKFVQNGVSGNKKATEVPAVSIGKGGGKTLIYNSVFHSNAGNPIEAAERTVMVNNTFALNGGHVKMASTGTDFEFHNNIIWRDDQNNGQATQYEGIVLDSHTTHNAITGLTKDAVNSNDPLSDANEDIVNGPNFEQPDADATDEEVVFNRNFRISPSISILSKASPAAYEQWVIGKEKPASVGSDRAWINYNETGDYALDEEGKTAREKAARPVYVNREYWEWIKEDNEGRNVFNVLDENGAILKANCFYEDLEDKDYTFDLSDHVDMANNPRFVDLGMDRGAYECQATLRRVIYADPAVNNSAPKGDMWQTAYGRGKMQDAVDAAAVYASQNNQTAYVLMRSRPNSTSVGETLIFRDGVQVYGSISGLEQVEDANGNLSEQDADIEAYLLKVKSNTPDYRTPMALSETRTTINGLVTGEQEYTVGALFDGFEISNPDATAPVVEITKQNLALRNSIIQDCAMTGAPVVRMTNGLLYNMLLHNNTTDNGQPVASVSGDAYILNCTGVPALTGQTVFSGPADHVLNSINVSDYGSRFRGFAPYLRRGGTAYNSNHYNTNQALWYQLQEESADINAGDNSHADKVAGYTYQLNSHTHKAVDYTSDFDLLGNPRVLMTTVDNGCFETWRVSDPAVATEVNTSGTYNGNYYPHQASVVYLMGNCSMTMKTGDFTTPLRPGFLLLKEGASFYVNGAEDHTGNVLQLTDVAVEKTLTGRYRLLSLPYRFNPAHTTTTDPTKSADLSGAYTYDSERRATWHGGFVFREENSAMWNRVTRDFQPNEGWLLAAGAGTYRFNGMSGASTDYIYTEDGPKTVALKQYDDRTSEEGDASFTKQENMGWNLTGMPYLVTSYSTSARDLDGNYAMNVPHVLYTMDGNGDYLRADGQIYSMQSWADGTALSIGDGFFTQTAVLGDEETLTFRMPVYTGATESAARQYVGISWADTDSTDSLRVDDVVTVQPKQGGSLAYRFGADGVKWFGFNEETPQLYVSSMAGVPLSLVDAAPFNTDITLGVVAPRAGRYVISLPEPDAYADVDHVWLSDSETGDVTDLLTAGYTMTIGDKGTYANRLSVRFGGVRPEVDPQGNEEAGANYRIYVRNRILYVEGLTEGDRVAVYTVGGQLVDRVTAMFSDYSRQVNQGIYVVRVNDYTKKVLSK